MKSSRQHTALQLWQLLPHALIWLALAVMCMLFGYGTFYNITPALPLMMALLLAWESPPVALPISLIGAGLLYDMLAGQALGLTAFCWYAVYWIHLRYLHTADGDAPFTFRWLRAAYQLLLYGGLEAGLAWALQLNRPSTAEFFMRLIFMALLIPALALLLMHVRRLTYRKLWMFLPPEVKPIG